MAGLLPSYPGMTTAIGIVLLGLIFAFLQRLHTRRTFMSKLPGPPHNYFLGSLVTIGKAAVKIPSNTAPQNVMQSVKETYQQGDYFYLDPWPLSSPMIIISDIDMFEQIIHKSATVKHYFVEEFMRFFGGPGNLVSSEGQEWKKWRAAFNPGFANRHLMTMVDAIVQEAETFSDIMTEHARNGDLFRMETATTKLTINIIGRIILDLDLNAQKGSNPLVDAFTSQTRWVYAGIQYRISELWDFRRPLILKYNNWKMDRYISQCLDKRFASRASRGKSKHVVDLALEAYLKDVHGETQDADNVSSLAQEFKQAAISNMKTFIFAGHDTTSSTISYALYYLSKNPDMLARLRQEHDDVFGSDPMAVSSRLKEDPNLLNKLDYTLAVTKEVLRIQPPASTVRSPAPGFILHDPATGEQLPTEGCMLYPVVTCMHRNPKYWKDPNVFNPDRFLPGSTDNVAAWIPFSKGNRNCIGQDLAIIETKIILAVFARRFDFTPAYHEVASLKNDGSGYPSLTQGVLEQFGDRAYQVQLGTAKPNEGMPCRLTLRN